jgi:hypothetical protein
MEENEETTGKKICRCKKSENVGMQIHSLMAVMAYLMAGKPNWS